MQTKKGQVVIAPRLYGSRRFKVVDGSHRISGGYVTTVRAIDSKAGDHPIWQFSFEICDQYIKPVG